MTHRTGVALAALVLLSAACFAQEAIPPDPVPIELVNPGFEDGLSGWSVVHPDVTSVDAEATHSGEAALLLSDETGASNAYVAQVARDLEGGGTYTLRAWFRGQAHGAGAQAALKIEGYTEEGTNPLGRYARERLTDALGDWQLIELTAEFPPEVNRASLLLRLFGPGTVWFDDVSFEQTAPAPVVTIGPERQAPEPGAREVTFTARLAEPLDATEPPINIHVYDPDDEIETEATYTRVDERIFEVTVTFAEPLEPGSYRVEANLGYTPGGMAWLHVPMTDRRPANLSDTGTILVGGEPFFPIGLYHVSPSHYPMIAEAGFNAVQGVVPSDLERFGAALDACVEHGIMMDVPLYADLKVKDNLAQSLAAIEAFADHPAVMCWKIIDEPDIRPDITDEVAEVYMALKAADPATPIELTLCQPPGFSYWAKFCDIMQVDPYPIPRQPLTMVSDWVALAMEGLEPWQNLTAVLQSGWIPEPMNQPTPEQARSMVYLSLIHGAKGIFWYSFRDPNWRLEETPLWDAFPAINAELHELSMPVMVGEPGERVSVESPGDVVHWRAWAHEGRTYLLLTNPLEEPVTATVDPGGPCSICDLRGEGLEEITATFRINLPGYGAETRVLTRR
ncbi:MAG: carbohydrate binding domain-containing protein [Armatimonadota bacterium]|jgi:hypothetical protein